MALDRQASCPWLQINQKERRGQMQREGGDNFLNTRAWTECQMQRESKELTKNSDDKNKQNSM